MFNALVSLDVVGNSHVLDLFAGSGALGIEALSRGATHCTFVESDSRARAAIQANLRSTDLEAPSTVVSSSAESFLAATGLVFDLALLDPPYAYGRWAELLETLAAEVIVIETDREFELGERWQVVRSKWYGTTLVVLARRVTHEA